MTIVGNVDHVRDQTISGWAQDPAAPDGRTEVFAWLDGHFHGRFLADGARPDLERAGIGDGRHAFGIPVPAHLLDGREHEVRIAASGGRDLAGSPRRVRLSDPTAAQSSSDEVVMLAIAKNEARYIEQWIAYHYAIGIGRFVIYDNDSDDGTGDLLRRNPRLTGIVEVIPWPPSAYPDTGGPQLPAYAHALRMLGQDDAWVAVLDIDEYLVPKQDRDVQGLLARYADLSALSVCWKVFGSAGLAEYDDRLLADRFRYAGAATLVKTIVRADQIETLHIHAPTLREGQALDELRRPIRALSESLSPTYACAQINHYFCKSWQEWEKKRRRGRAGPAAGASNHLRPDSHFHGMDQAHTYDNAIQRFVPRMRAVLAELFPESISTGPGATSPKAAAADRTISGAGKARRVFIHLGLHKTGTTSFQNYLANHRDSLRQAGILVPGTGVPGAFIGGQHELAWSLRPATTEDATDREEVWRRLRHEIDDSDCSRVILSTEDFALLQRPEIEAVAHHLAGYDLIPVIVLRRSSDIVEGAYRTFVLSGSALDFAQFLDIDPVRRDYAAMVADWHAIAATGRMIIVSYDDPQVGTDVVAALMRLIAPEIEVAASEERLRANPGRPAALVELGRMMRGQGVAADTVRQWVGEMAKGALAGPAAADRFMTPAVEVELDRAYREDIARITGNPAWADLVRSDIPVPSPRRWSTIDGPAAALLRLPELMGIQASETVVRAVPERLFPTPTLQRPGRVSGHLDQPDGAQGSIIIDRRHPVEIAGWLFEIDPAPSGTRVLHFRSEDVRRSGHLLVRLPDRLARPDVGEAFPEVPAEFSVPSGFRVRLDPRPIAVGRYHLFLGVADAAGIAYAGTAYALEIR